MSDVYHLQSALHVVIDCVLFLAQSTLERLFLIVLLLSPSDSFRVLFD